MKKILLSILFLTIMSGCSDTSVGEMCQETSDIMKKKYGRGFSKGDMQRCIEQDVEKTKKMLEEFKKNK